MEFFWIEMKGIGVYIGCVYLGGIKINIVCNVKVIENMDLSDEDLVDCFE